MKKKELNYLGFTLIELLMAVSITIIMGSLLLAIFVRSNTLFHAEQNKVSQGLSLTDSLKKISDLVKISSAVVGSYTVGPSTYISGTTSLVLALPSVDASGNNIPNTFDYAVIMPDTSGSHILRLKTFPSAQSTRKSQDTVLSSNLSKILFSYFDSNGVPTLPTNATRVNVTVNTLEQSALFTMPSSASADISLRNN